MMNLGDFTTAQTIYVPLTTYDSDGASITLTGLATTDIEIYKDGSVTQRSSDSGFALLDTDGIDFDSTTGLHGFSIDLSDNTDAGFYAAGSQYWLIVNAVTVDTQTVVVGYYFTIGMNLRATTAGRTLDVTATGAAGIDWANVEGKTSTVGLTNTTVGVSSVNTDIVALIGTPADTDVSTDIANVSAQVSAISLSAGVISVEATSDNTGGAIKGATFAGSVITGTFASTEAEDGTYHQIDDDSSDIDIVYGFQVGGTSKAGTVEFIGYLKIVTDSLNIQAYDFVGSDWETRAVLSGQSGTTNIVQSVSLLAKHTGTDADLGKVYIRFAVGSGSASSSFNVDQLLVGAVNTAGSQGFVDGSVWVDTNNGQSGTTEGIGTLVLPSNNIEDARSIADANKLKRIHFLPGSSDSLSEEMDGFEFLGFSYTIILNGKSVSGALFSGALIIGNDDGSNGTHTVYESCTMVGNTLGLHHRTRCGLAGNDTLAEAGTYIWEGCFSTVAGNGTPSVDFVSESGAKDLSIRHYSGGAEFKNLGSGGGTHTVSFDCEVGQYVLNANCDGGNITVRGNCSKTDNSGNVTITEDARFDITRGVQLGAIQTQSWASSLEASSNEVIECNVDTTTTPHTPTITEFETAELQSGTADNYLDRDIYFIDNNLAGQKTTVVGSAWTGSVTTLTVKALTEAPASNDAFIIV